MAKILIGNVKPVKGVDYFTPEDIEEMGKSFATKESVDNINTSLKAMQEDVDALTASVEELQEAASGVEGKFAPAYTYGTDDLEAGTTPLETGKLHFVYEE